jgi:RNA-directed DNA polymerase
VERTVWTERMLEALEKGVKGGVWFSLIDKVYRPESLHKGWLQVKANKGAAGVDHQSIEAFEKELERNLGRLHEELRDGSYRPRPIRRVYIEKPGSKEKRPLGIPAVRDRVVEAALRMVIEPIFERQFSPHSYGFRPKRGCKDALRRVERLLKEGYSWVIDVDLKAYFDSIPHKGLMEEIRKHIADGRVLGLIEGYLKQEIFEGLEHWSPQEGTPQGAVISPLLANIYLHPLDMEMSAASYEMTRYADDIVVMCRSEEEGLRALEHIRRLTGKMGLTLHPEKTRLVDATVPGEGFDFLGYHFECGTRWPRKKSLKRFKDTVRWKSRRSNGHSMEAIVEDLNRTLKGWFEYFKHSRKMTFRPLDGWIRRRLRSILRTRSKQRGISRGWDNQRWPKRYFRDFGLFSLEEAHRALLQSSRG